MYTIRGNVRTYLASCSSPDDLGDYSVRDVGEDDGVLVRSYRELREYVAHITFYNPSYEILFRGQRKDFKTQPNKYPSRSSLFPSIYRTSAGRRGKRARTVKTLMKELYNKTEVLQDRFYSRGGFRIRKFNEVAWAILQHYEQSDTPLLDLTGSLTTAATFACINNTEDIGYIYVLGMPVTHSSISYHPDHDIVNVKLSAACPPKALRAHLQEAHFVGSFPMKSYSKGNNVASRLIGKFRIKRSDFMNEGIIWPEEYIYPEDDEIKTTLGAMF